jgi:hypothetical protein
VLEKEFPHCIGRRKVVVILKCGPFVFTVHKGVQDNLTAILTTAIFVDYQLATLTGRFLWRRSAAFGVYPELDCGSPKRDAGETKCAPEKSKPFLVTKRSAVSAMLFADEM